MASRNTSSGVVVQDRNTGTPSTVAEVRAEGTVLAARLERHVQIAHGHFGCHREEHGSEVGGFRRGGRTSRERGTLRGFVPRPRREDRRVDRGELWLLALRGPQPQVPGLVGAHFRGFRCGAEVREEIALRFRRLGA